MAEPAHHHPITKSKIESLINILSENDLGLISETVHRVYRENELLLVLKEDLRKDSLICLHNKPYEKMPEEAQTLINEARKKGYTILKVPKHQLKKFYREL